MNYLVNKTLISNLVIYTSWCDLYNHGDGNDYMWECFYSRFQIDHYLDKVDPTNVIKKVKTYMSKVKKFIDIQRLYCTKNTVWNDDLVSEELMQDRKFVSMIVCQYNIHNLKNKQSVIYAIEQSGLRFIYIRNEFKNDREIVLAAVKQNGRVLAHLCEEFKNDRDIVLMAVRTNGEALAFASDLLRIDREIVLAAIKSDASAIVYTSDELKNDREFILEAIRKNGKALFFSRESI